MDKYKDGFQKRIKPKMNHDTGEYGIQPFRDAQEALGKAEFAVREREQFFGEAYSEILADLFVTWLKTEPHCSKEREFLYHTAMALGSVKEKMVQAEMYGTNIKFMQKQKALEEQKDADE